MLLIKAIRDYENSVGDSMNTMGLVMYTLVGHPHFREHFSLKNEESDQTIWNCIQEL